MEEVDSELEFEGREKWHCVANLGEKRAPCRKGSKRDVKRTVYANNSKEREVQRSWL